MISHCQAEDKTPPSSGPVESSAYTPGNTTSTWNDDMLPLAIKENPYKVSLFDPQNGEDKERLWSQTKLMFGLGLGVAGVISLLPSEISNWEKSDEGPMEKWWNNVRSGPTWDNDSWYLNYIGHPYFGGVYYQVARKSGYRQWDSFMYTVLMSTFYWEYGLESFAEVPSIQDLVVTPIGGWLWGEWAYNKEIAIRNNGGTVFGSQSWGSVSLFFLDPVDSIGVGINKLMGREFVKAGTAWVSNNPAPTIDAYTPSKDTYWSVNFAYRF